MSILKTTNSGKHTRLTEKFLLDRGYKKDTTTGGFEGDETVWKVPENVNHIGNYQLKSKGAVFYCQLWFRQLPTIIRTVEALLYLEKHWGAKYPEMNKFAELVESCQS